MSMFDGIPQAVATIVSAYVTNFGRPRDQSGSDELEKRLIGLTDQLTRTITKALREETK